MALKKRLSTTARPITNLIRRANQADIGYDVLGSLGLEEPNVKEAVKEAIKKTKNIVNKKELSSAILRSKDTKSKVIKLKTDIEDIKKEQEKSNSRLDEKLDGIKEDIQKNQEKFNTKIDETFNNVKEDIQNLGKEIKKNLKIEKLIKKTETKVNKTFTKVPKESLLPKEEQSGANVLDILLGGEQEESEKKKKTSATKADIEATIARSKDTKAKLSSLNAAINNSLIPKIAAIYKTVNNTNKVVNNIIKIQHTQRGPRANTANNTPPNNPRPKNPVPPKKGKPINPLKTKIPHKHGIDLTATGMFNFLKRGVKHWHEQKQKIHTVPRPNIWNTPGSIANRFTKGYVKPKTTPNFKTMKPATVINPSATGFGGLGGAVLGAAGGATGGGAVGAGVGAAAGLGLSAGVLGAGLGAFAYKGLQYANDPSMFTRDEAALANTAAQQRTPLQTHDFYIRDGKKYDSTTGEEIKEAPKAVGKEAFTNAYMPLAVEQSQRTGVAPEIILGQAALETGWGAHAPGNNYFGIKGPGQVLMTKEAGPGGALHSEQASFRGYRTVEDSFKDYGDFLLQNQRYKQLMEIGKNGGTLEQQAAALQATGYATATNYGDSVLGIANGLRGRASAPSTQVANKPSMNDFKFNVASNAPNPTSPSTPSSASVPATPNASKPSVKPSPRSIDVGAITPPKQTNIPPVIVAPTQTAMVNQPPTRERNKIPPVRQNDDPIIMKILHDNMSMIA